MNFNSLVNQIKQTHSQLQEYASKAINTSLTVRNWLIGYYIVEFEQKGEDRAKYGSQLLKNLSKDLKIKGLSVTTLKTNRQFYVVYPYLNEAFQSNSEFKRIGQTVSDQFQSINNGIITENNGKIEQSLKVPSNKILSRLSFSHLIEIIKLEEPLKRTFYELEAIKGTWSVRELQRQIETMYFERSGLSKDKKTLSQLTNNKSIPQQANDIIKNIYSFEFLGLPQINVVEETELEQALLSNFQQFILELGTGFCFEARQKRILIDDEYYFIDLVFYHRVLHCHVLIELKTKKFKAHNAAQLNTYLSYYKKEVVSKIDNPPIGILLVADKKNTLVEFATAGMDENLFIQKYLLELPSKKEIENYLINELSKL